MFGLKKSPLNKNAKQNSVNRGFGGYSGSNPFDSDDELSGYSGSNPFDSDDELGSSSHHFTKSSEPAVLDPTFVKNSFDHVKDESQASSSFYSLNLTTRSKYKNDFRDSRGLENQTLQELENYAVQKEEETTRNVNNCIKIAEDIREDATNTLVTLHQQGEQITRTHLAAADIDHDLTRGEKLLGSLGGIFSKTWKPTRIRTITGPFVTRDDPARRKGNHLEQREKLGLTPAPKGRSNTNAPPPFEPTNALQKVESENAKQDIALSDLSNLLEELKDMAVDMGSEIDRQNKGLDPFMDDVEELNSRVKGANQRGRRLLRK